MNHYYRDESVTIYHANCLEVLSMLKGVDLMLTDPPYGIEMSSNWGGRQGACKIIGDCDASLRDAVLQKAQYHGAIVFGSPRVKRPNGAKMTLIWEKGEHVGMGNLSLPWKPNYEEIYVLGTGFGGRRDSSILRFNAVAGCVGRVKSRHHPTEKPVDLLRYLIGKHRSTIVLDPFCGSGSTLVAAKSLGLPSIGIEIEEKYCEIAVKRMLQSSIFSAMPQAIETMQQSDLFTPGDRP